MLADVLEICDRITVLRDGRVVETVRAGDVGEDDLARMMVGRRLERLAARTPGPGPGPDGGTAETGGDGPGGGGTGSAAEGQDAGTGTDAGGGPDRAPALRVRGLTRPPRLKPVDLDLAAGEVVAVFGLVGAGRTRLGRTLFGLEPATGGSMEVLGRAVEVSSPVAAIAAGLGYLGEDRALGVVPRMSVAQNITLASLGSLGRGPAVDFGREATLAQHWVDELGIRTPSLDHPAGTLSGGNQQKVLLARWLCSGAKVLILDDPTRGIDVGAKEEVFRLVHRLAGDGMAIVYLTSELKEAKALADRVLVMAGGRVVRSAPPDTPDEEFMAAAGGSHG
jgi:ABC-type sugar transport system ATPase subunit